MKRTLGIAIAIVMFALPASAHTDSELETWHTDWADRLAQQFDGRGADVVVLEDLWLELEDMQDRHPCRKVIDTWNSVCSAGPSVHRDIGANVEQWRGLVASYFPADQVERALCIMYWESRGDPTAKNPSSSARGLFQILASLWAPHFGVSYNDLYDPVINTSIARKVYDIQGWWAWSPYKRGRCR